MSGKQSCDYCGAGHDSGDQLTQHLIEQHDRDELSRIDQKRVEQYRSSHESRLRQALQPASVSRRTFGVGLLGAIGVGALGAYRFASAQPQSNLVAEYLFDGNFADTSPDGANITGTGSGNPSFAPGIRDQAVELDGSTDYVAVDTTGSEYTPSGDAWSISAWVNSDGPTGSGDQIVRRDQSASAGRLYNLRLNSDRTVRLEFDPSVGGTSTIESFATSETVPTGEWTHVAGVIRSAGAEIYINGEQAATGPGSGGTFGPISGGELQIGAFGLDFGEYFNGRIDEVRLYDRDLSTGEIDELAQKPAWGITVEADNATISNTTIDGSNQ